MESDDELMAEEQFSLFLSRVTASALTSSWPGRLAARVHRCQSRSSI